MDSAGGSTSGGGQRSNNQSWTNEKEARLISLYGMYRLLWDNRHPEYYKKDSREQAINAIAQGLDNEFNVVNVKDKIKSLRDYFVKELRKEAASRKSPALRPYVSRWEHFRSWDFLRSVVCCDPSVQSPPTVDLPSGPLGGLHCVIDAMLPTLVRPRASRRTGVKRERQEMYPGFFDAEGPDVILPSSPECSSDEDEVRPNSRKTGSSSPPPPPVPQASGSSGLAPQDHALAGPQPKTEQRSSPSPPSYPDRDSIMSPNPPPPRRARLSRSPERPQENHLGATPSSFGGGQPPRPKSSPVPSPVATCTDFVPVGTESRNPIWFTGGNGGGGGGPAPLDPELPYHDEEELFCRQVLMELRQMERYRRAMAKLRIRQVLFEIKYWALHAPVRGQRGN
ncbi:uncharacterized protein LOC144118365 [Amblyomma americanum]